MTQDAQTLTVLDLPSPPVSQSDDMISHKGRDESSFVTAFPDTEGVLIQYHQSPTSVILVVPPLCSGATPFPVRCISLLTVSGTVSALSKGRASMLAAGVEGAAWHQYCAPSQ